MLKLKSVREVTKGNQQVYRIHYYTATGITYLNSIIYVPVETLVSLSIKIPTKLNFYKLEEFCRTVGVGYN